MMIISVIMAITDEGVIGNAGGRLPWHLPEDLKRFARVTKGRTLIMGRKTHESILARNGQPLPERHSIVISSDLRYSVPEGCSLVDSWEQALQTARRIESREVFVIGGKRVFETALPIAHKIYLSQIHWPFLGEIRVDLSKITREDFLVIHQEDFQPNFPEAENPPWTYQLLKRRFFVVMDHARTSNQRSQMLDIQGDQVCPFCPEFLQKYHKPEIIRTNQSWVATRNEYPYENTRYHFLLIAQRHVGTFVELTITERLDLLEMAEWLIRTYKIESGGLVMRFGDPTQNGSSVNHLHAHIACAEIINQDHPAYKPVKFKIG